MIPPADQTWTPNSPPDRLTRSPVGDSPRWRGYLVAQGYGPQEIPATLDGLAEAAELRVAAVERSAVESGGELDADGQATARAGAVRAWLQAHPPARVLELDPRPPAALDAEAFGGRLVPLEAGPGAVQVLGDLITGRRWWTVGETGPRASLPVVAGALYRLVGVAAPAARLVVLGGQLQAVHPEPQAWEPLTGATLTRWLPTLVQELPADAWLAWAGGASGIRGRVHAMPGGLAGTMRLALGDTLGRRRGRKAPTWGVDAPELEGLVSSRPWISARDLGPMGPMGRRLARVTDTAIRQAVALGRLEAPEAGALAATLMGRRDVVAGKVKALIGGAAGTV